MNYVIVKRCDPKKGLPNPSKDSDLIDLNASTDFSLNITQYSF